MSPSCPVPLMLERGTYISEGNRLCSSFPERPSTIEFVINN